MQDLVTDKLASKRIPAASSLNTLPHLVGEYAKAIHTGRPALTTGGSAATAKGASAGPATAMAIELDRTYTGYMPITGTLSADNGQNGTWSGNMKSTLYVSVDRYGNGTGYDHFSGNITLHVGDRSSTEPLTFDTPAFTLQRGKFDYTSQEFSYDSLLFSVEVKGSFAGSQQTISEHLSLPFTGFVNGVSVSGSMNGSSLVKTPPLTLSGTSSAQTDYEASNTRPFRNTLISDLSGTTVTATVTLSNAANGALTNLAGGTYDQAKGIYTVTGTDAAVASAIKGLTFVAAGDVASTGHAARTYFNLHVTDGTGAFRTAHALVTTSAPLFISGIVLRESTNGTTGIKPFQHAAVAEFNGGHLDTLTIKLSNPGNGMLEDLSGGVYNRKAGVYVFTGTANAATRALQTLKFVPAKPGLNTTFTITAENTNGALRTATTTVASKSAAVGAKAKAGVALFSQYVALGLHGAHDQASALSSRRDLPAHPLFELAGSHR